MNQVPPIALSQQVEGRGLTSPPLNQDGDDPFLSTGMSSTSRVLFPNPEPVRATFPNTSYMLH